MGELRWRLLQWGGALRISRAIRNLVLRTPMAASLWTTYDRLAYLLAARTAELSRPKQ